MIVTDLGGWKSMKIISCDECGALFDQDKINWPPMYDDNDEMIDANVTWNGDGFTPCIQCPVCKNHSLEKQ